MVDPFSLITIALYVTESVPTLTHSHTHTHTLGPKLSRPGG